MNFRDLRKFEARVSGVIDLAHAPAPTSETTSYEPILDPGDRDMNASPGGF
jgi:hypothetical protein